MLRRDVPAGYVPLTEKTVPAFLASNVGAVRALGGSPREWRAREVGDGNLNMVFIAEGPAGAVVVKQALPYVRLVGESWPLPLRRSFFEWNALRAHAEHAPALVPKLYGFDETQAAIVMEYLTPHLILRKVFIRGVVYPRLAEDLSEFLARTLFGTSDLALGGEVKRAQVALFSENAELCRLTETFVFTDPYRVADLNRWTRPHLDAWAERTREDAELKVAAQRLKWRFLTSTEALVHGDLHSGSIMATPDDTRVIDPEFAFFGPMGFDVGAVLGNVLLAFFSQTGHEERPGARDGYRDWLLETFCAVWDGFERKFLDLWRTAAHGDAYPVELFSSEADRAALEAERRRFLRDRFIDTLGFAGIKMTRRILGVAHVEDLEAIADPAVRAACEVQALRSARELVVAPDGFASAREVASRAAALL